jgi:hypothetical protein
MNSFVITALPAGEVDTQARDARRQVADSPLPCRRCLRNAAIGDELASRSPAGSCRSVPTTARR